MIADKEKWGSLLKVLEINTKTVTKKTGKETVERRFYITDLDFGAKRLSDISSSHWAIESMHWVLDRDFKQDCVKGKTKKRQGTLTQYSVAAYPSYRRGRRKKKSDKQTGVVKIIESCSSFSYLKRLPALK